MKLRNLLLVSLAAFGLVALPTAPANALLVKVSVNFGPTLVGPDNGTLVVTANPGDLLIITWALGTDVAMDRYDGFISGSPPTPTGQPGVDTAEITRVGGSALELTGQGFDPIGNPNAPDTEVFYDARSDGAPIGFAGNGGELWRVEYLVTNPVTDAAPEVTYSFFESYTCRGDIVIPCPGTPGSASLRVDAVPEPSTLLLLGLGLAGFAGRRANP